MSSERYVVLGLAPARTRWFSEVAQWSDAGLLPVEFVKCVSLEELRARLTSSRPHSAVLVDAVFQPPDRDLIDLAHRHDCPVIGIGEHRPSGPDLFDGMLPSAFGPSELSGALRGRARLIGRVDVLPPPLETPAVTGPDACAAITVMVCGPGGTGTSTAAIALAQGLAASGQQTALADFALRAEQGMIHQVPEAGPGVQELAELHRLSRASTAEVRDLTWFVEERGYHLLLGLRRRRAWAALRPRAFERGFDGLRLAYEVVVVDADDDLEGEADGGSMDVEERHVMARTVARLADVVLVVGRPGLKGIHALMATLADVVAFGVPTDRIIPIVNQAPRRASARAEISKALSQLGPQGTTPVFVPQRAVDEPLIEGARLPGSVVAPFVEAYQSVIRRAGRRDEPAREPTPVLRGTIGSWSA